MWIYKSLLSCTEFIQSESEFSKKYIRELNGEYDRFTKERIPPLTMSLFREYKQSGRRIGYESVYFKRRAMLRDFALKAWLGDDDAVTYLENIIKSVSEEFTWALPAHVGTDDAETVIDLFAAETAHSITEIVSLLGEKLSNDTRERAIYEVKRRVLIPFITRHKPYNWENMDNNWCAVCGGCVGMTAIYLIPDTAALKEIVTCLSDVFESYMKSFSDDGACLEGLYYWGYGMTYLTAFLELYRERVGEKFPVNTEKLTKMADFAPKCCVADGITVSFSDSSEHDKIYAGLSCRLNEVFGTARAGYEYTAGFLGDDCGRWCRAARDIAWTKNIKTTEKNDELSVFPSAQWVISRRNGYAFTFKGGNNGEPHNHNDVGSFTAVKNGNVIICDLGAGEYTADYFSDKRYNSLCARSGGHSVVMIDGIEQSAGSEFAAKSFFADRNSAAADICGAYNTACLTKCLRTISIGNGITLSDNMRLARLSRVTERFITRHKAVLSADGVNIISDGDIIASLMTDNLCTVNIHAATHSEHDGTLYEVTVIDFEFDAEGDYEFIMLIQ